MKTKLLIASLMLLTLKLTAQKLPELTDDVFPGKPEMLKKFTRYDPKIDSVTKFTKMPIDAFINKINQFKMAAYQVADQDTDIPRGKLKKDDIDYFIYTTVKNYAKLYGSDPSPLKPGEKSRKLITINAGEIKKLETQISDPDFNMNNAALYKVSAAYRHWINEHLIYEGCKKFPADLALGNWGYQVSTLKAAETMLDDPFIKEDQMYKTIVLIFSAIKDTTAKENAYRDFMAAATDQSYKDAIQPLYNNFKTMETRFVAPDFNFQDVNGKLISLKSLRGEYVYIDFWATWCLPCKKQFPFLAPIEKKLEGKMHFVGISIDKPEDKNKWSSYVKNTKLGGIQLLADKGPVSDFVQKFNVNAVPRFLIIDPEGKVLYSEAKAPSDPQLEYQLTELLKN